MYKDGHGSFPDKITAIEKGYEISFWFIWPRLTARAHQYNSIPDGVKPSRGGQWMRALYALAPPNQVYKKASFSNWSPRLSVALSLNWCWKLRGWKFRLSYQVTYQRKWSGSFYQWYWWWHCHRAWKPSTDCTISVNPSCSTKRIIANRYRQISFCATI